MKIKLSIICLFVGITVSFGQCPINNLTTTTPVSCNGGSDGTATANPSNGTAPYSIVWTAPSGPPQNGATAVGLSAGVTYTLTINDATPCAALVEFVTVAQPSPLSLATSSTTVTCFGGSDGTASVVATGGTPPYSYSWPVGGQSTQNISGQMAGTYTVKVTDANLCTATANVVIAQPSNPYGVVNGSATVCNGANTGTLTLTAFTGTVLNWQSSTDLGVSWTVIANTTPTLNYTNLTLNTEYEAVVQNGACGSSTSTIATITMAASSVGGTINGSATVCAGANAGSLTVTGNTGNVLNWESSTDGGITWITIANTGTSQSYSNLTVTTAYRVIVQSGSCPAATSASGTITVNNASVGGTIASSATVCSGANAGTLTLSGNSGNIIKWQFSTNGGASWNNIANITAAQNYNNLIITTEYIAVVQSGVCPSINSSIANITVNPVSAGGTIAGSATVCSGANGGVLTLSANTGNVVSWESSTDGGATWNTIINNGLTQNYSNLTITTAYRAIVQSGVCASATSAAATVTVNPVSVGGTTSGSATVCSGVNAGTITLAGFTGTVLNWQFSTNGGGSWTNLVNTTNSQSYLNLNTTTEYMAVVQSGVCASANSSVSTVTVSPASAGGTVSGSATVCAGANGGTLTLSGNTGNIIRWESSTDGGTTWVTITNTTTTQGYNNLNVTTSYRAIVQSGACAAVPSATATVTVNPVSVGGTTSGSATVCSGANAGTITLSGFTGSIIKWQFSTNGGATWTDIANITASQTYTNINTTTSYVAVVQSGVCAASNSSVSTVTVSPASVGGTIAASATVCSGSNSGILTLTGNTGNILNWESSVDGGTTWVSVVNSSATQGYNNLTITTSYRAIIQSGVCAPVASASATITVNPVSAGGTTSGAATVCSGANAGTITLSGFTGSITKWQFSTNGGASWTDIANTTASQTYNNLIISTEYIAVVQSGVCAPANSPPTTITVTPPSVGGNVTGSATVCSGSNNGTLTLNGSTGNILRWESSTDGGTTWVTITNTTTTQGYNNLTITTMYRAIVQSGVCVSAISASATVTVNPVSVGGTTLGSTTVCSGVNAGTITLSGFTGNILHWASSIDNGVTWTNIVNTTATQTYTNLNITTEYMAVVQSGVCASANSTVSTITVNPASVGGLLAANASVCSGSNGGTLHLTGYTGTILRWETSTDGGNTWLTDMSSIDTANYHNLTITTQYRVIVQNGVCPSVPSDTAKITVSPVSIGGTTAGAAIVCSGANSGTITLSGYVGNITSWASSTDGGITYTTIANTTASQTYTNLNTSTLYVAIVKSGVCSRDTSLSTLITVNPTPVANFTVAPVCIGQTSVFVNTSTVSSGILQFTMWDFADSTSSTATNPIHVYANPGTYAVTLKVITDKGCVNSVTINAVVNPLPNPTITPSGPLDFCFGGSVTLTGVNGLAYAWSTGDTTQSIIVTASGTYTLVVTNPATGCVNSDSIKVVVWPLPVVFAGNDTTISLGFSYTLNATGGVIYSWAPATGLSNPNIYNPIAEPLVTTNYILTVTDNNGCVNTDALNIYVIDDYLFTVANVLTPNGDGLNDVWNIMNIENYPDNSVTIFNRYGQEVFSESPYKNDWDGIYGGQLLPDGTYYYVLKFAKSSKIFKGGVTIVDGKKN